MNFDLDIIIFVCFLVVTLVAGIISGCGVSNIKEYAIGNRSFSTMALSATIIATWISGGFFSYILSEAYSNGLYFIIPLIGDTISFMIIAYFFVPRTIEFLGDLSVAETVGKMYGKNSRLLASVVGIFSCIGGIAVQFKVSTVMIQMLFGLSNYYAILVSAIIVIFYSTFGGIKSVTFTDIIQFFTFGTIIPIITIVIWEAFTDYSEVVNTIFNNKLFNYKEVLSYQNPKFIPTLTLLFFFAIPHLNPVQFQRILMAKDIKQASKSFFIAAIICLLIYATICLVSVLLFAKNPNINPEELSSYIIKEYVHDGFKGLIVIGVMAMVMSTTDSLINSAAVIFSHDFCQPLGIITTKQELLSSRLFSVFVGILSFILASKSSTLLKLAMMVASYYSCVVTVPLILAIIGFRSSSESFLIAAGGGLATVVIWRIFFMDTGIDSVVPGMLANLVFFIGGHYLLKQPIHQKKIKDDTNLLQDILNKYSKIKKFNFFRFCISNLPNSETTFALVGIFSIISSYTAMFAMDASNRNQYHAIIQVSNYIVLIMSCTLLTYPLWSSKLKVNKFIAVLWNSCLFYILVFVSTLQVMISDFNQIHLIIFLTNLVIVSILLRWQVALFMIIIGIIAAIQFFKLQADVNNLSYNIWTIQFKIIYILAIVATILIAFLKPKQEQLEYTENTVSLLDRKVHSLGDKITNLNHKVSHYNETINLQAKEIARLGKTAETILNNVNHNLRLPIGNVINFSEMLKSGLEKYGKDHLKTLTEEVYKNSNKLSTMILNMLDLAVLQAKKIHLEKITINFSEIVINRIKACQDIYLGNKNLTFELNIEPKIMTDVDVNYMKQTIDNLVINSIQYSKKGVIVINLKKVGSYIEFSISDEGIGIPETDLLTIFEPFAVSSKTETPAGNRGVGLSLCKSAVIAHGGTIKAKSNGLVGATFILTLPTT